MANLNQRILDILKVSKKLKASDIDRIQAQCGQEGSGKMREALIRLEVVSEKELVSILSAELKIPFINLSKYKLQADLAKTLPGEIARKYKIIPVSKIGDVLTLAISDPSNIFVIDDISMAAHCKVECVISAQKDIEEALDRLYGSGHESMHAIAQKMDTPDEEVQVLKFGEESDGASSRSESAEAPIVKMVDLLLQEALKRRASDIHIEPFEKDLRVRYRVDGNLEEVLSIPKKNQNAVLTRLKIMSKLDITESRVPQDGRLKIRLKDKEVDFRVSVLPVHFGSKVVMRVLDKSGVGGGLESLGVSPESLQRLRQAIARPFGMILITGPTGSGKSTTLYSLLSELNTPDKNMITIEDPIEYQMNGITQIQTKSEIGLDFANGLRAILRQSPDVVMVGEIRDSETADIAVKASLTGQLVLSTLHTNDAAGTMARLADMGVEPFLIASSVILVAAQRLCRKVCPACRQRTEIPPEVFERLGIEIEKIAPNPKDRTFFSPKGCERCRQTGYLGRMAILEVLAVDETVRNFLINRAAAHVIKNYAVKQGMVTLRDDALKKFCQGLTTLEEVVRLTSGEEE